MRYEFKVRVKDTVEPIVGVTCFWQTVDQAVSQGTAQLYFTPSDMDLSIETQITCTRRLVSDIIAGVGRNAARATGFSEA